MAAQEVMRATYKLDVVGLNSSVILLFIVLGSGADAR